MKIVHKHNTHVQGVPLVAKHPRDLNGDNLFDIYFLPYLLYHKATKEEQEFFKTLCHRIFYNGVGKGRKEMKDQMLELWERIRDLKAEKGIKKETA